MRYVLQQTMAGTPMWYSSEIARASGGTHGWSVEERQANVWDTRTDAEDYHRIHLMADPEIQVVEHGPSR